MKYLLQIYGNVTRDEVAALSDEERNALYADWGAVNQTPGMTPGLEMADPSTATTVRVEDGKTLDDGRAVRRDQGGARRLLPARGRRPRRRDRGRRAHADGEHRRRNRGPPAGGALIERVFRDEWGRVLASLIGFLGDFDLAEEATQEAFAIAAQRWPRDGAPRTRRLADPTARNHAIDRIRRERTLADKTEAARAARPRRGPRWTTRLPGRTARARSSRAAIRRSPSEAQVALTLRALGGLDAPTRSRARSSSRSRRWRSGSSGPSGRSGRRASRSARRPRICCRTGSPPCSPSST